MVPHLRLNLRMENLLDLPNDIVFTIFQHLTVEELIRLETVGGFTFHTRKQLTTLSI